MWWLLAATTSIHAAAHAMMSRKSSSADGAPYGHCSMPPAKTFVAIACLQEAPLSMYLATQCATHTDYSLQLYTVISATPLPLTVRCAACVAVSTCLSSTLHQLLALLKQRLQSLLSNDNSMYSRAALAVSTIEYLQQQGGIHIQHFLRSSAAPSTAPVDHNSMYSRAALAISTDDT
jgi:hypothetical protein